MEDITLTDGQQPTTKQPTIVLSSKCHHEIKIGTPAILALQLAVYSETCCGLPADPHRLEMDTCHRDGAAEGVYIFIGSLRSRRHYFDY